MSLQKSFGWINSFRVNSIKQPQYFFEQTPLHTPKASYKLQFFIESHVANFINKILMVSYINSLLVYDNFQIMI